MKSSNMLNSGSNLTSEEDRVERAENEDQTCEKYVYMPTLPSAFKSLVGKTVKIEMEEPGRVIELLGDVLGVTDYKTNKAAFWFLDTVALQVLRYKDDLDDYYRGVLISWLAGEMKLIRDKKLSREDFFNEIRVLFLHVADKLSRGDQLLHWELLIDEYSKITSLRSTVNESATNGATNILSKKSLQSSEISSMITNNSQTDAIKNVTEAFGLTDPNIVLDRIIEATYSMYANELRYALVYAAFVTPIQMHTYYVPHSLHIPRQIKLADSGAGPFDVQLDERLEKTASKLTNSNGTDKKHKEKKKANAKKKQIIKDLNTETTSPPPSPLIEEEILTSNRQFILPLIEAKEAAQLFKMHTENI